MMNYQYKFPLNYPVLKHYFTISLSSDVSYPSNIISILGIIFYDSFINCNIFIYVGSFINIIYINLYAFYIRN